MGRALVQDTWPWRGQGGGPGGSAVRAVPRILFFSTLGTLFVAIVVFNIFQFSHYFHFSFSFSGTLSILITAILMSLFASLSSLPFLR